MLNERQYAALLMSVSVNLAILAVFGVISEDDGRDLSILLDKRIADFKVQRAEGTPSDG